MMDVLEAPTPPLFKRISTSLPPVTLTVKSPSSRRASKSASRLLTTTAPSPLASNSQASVKLLAPKVCSESFSSSTRFNALTVMVSTSSMALTTNEPEPAVTKISFVVSLSVSTVKRPVKFGATTSRVVFTIRKSPLPARLRPPSSSNALASIVTSPVVELFTIKYSASPVKTKSTSVSLSESKSAFTVISRISVLPSILSSPLMVKLPVPAVTVSFGVVPSTPVIDAVVISTSPLVLLAMTFVSKSVTTNAELPTKVMVAVNSVASTSTEPASEVIEVMAVPVSTSTSVAPTRVITSMAPVNGVVPAPEASIIAPEATRSTRTSALSPKIDKVLSAAIKEASIYVSLMA